MDWDGTYFIDPMTAPTMVADNGLQFSRSHLLSTVIKFFERTSNSFKNFLSIETGDLDIRIANKYRLGSKIGGGSFGDIYLGELQKF